MVPSQHCQTPECPLSSSAAPGLLLLPCCPNAGVVSPHLCASSGKELVMFRSVLPHFACVSLFLQLALVIQIRLWKEKGILAIVGPCHVLALAASLPLPAWSLSGKQRFHYKEFLHLSLHRSSWLLLAPLLTPPVPVITAPPCSLCPEGAHRFQWIRNLVPEFGISSSHVKVLSSPAEFYELLKVRCGLQVVGMVLIQSQICSCCLVTALVWNRFSCRECVLQFPRKHQFLP